MFPAGFLASGTRESVTREGHSGEERMRIIDHGSNAIKYIVILISRAKCILLHKNVYVVYVLRAIMRHN